MTAEKLEARAEFLFRLRARGLRDLAVLRALEAVPRDAFVPHRYADLAARDIALPLPCGQTLSPPSLVGRMAEAMSVSPSHRVLEVGSGSGYATAVLAQLAREVFGVERFRTLARAAEARLSTLGIVNATVAWGDGLAVPPERGPFDRVLVHGVLTDGPDALSSLLSPNGAIVFARAGPEGQRVVRADRAEGGVWTVTPVTPSRLRALYDGPSRLL